MVLPAVVASNFISAYHVGRCDGSPDALGGPLEDAHVESEGDVQHPPHRHQWRHVLRELGRFYFILFYYYYFF